MKLFHRSLQTIGFTLVEMLVVIGVIGLLAGILLPVLAKAKRKAQMITCLNNKHQLGIAWVTYSTENDDKLVRNGHSGYKKQDNWVTGFMNWELLEDNTNSAYLTDPDYALLAPYCGRSAKLFKCPSDRFVSALQREAGWTARTRSVSMNYYMGDGESRAYGRGPKLNYWDQPYLFLALHSFRISPSVAWVIMDEHPDAMMYPSFNIIPEDQSGGSAMWRSVPASYHNGGTTMIYADAHAEYKRWRLPETKLAVIFQGIGGGRLDRMRRQGRDDYLWLAERSVNRKPER